MAFETLLGNDRLKQNLTGALNRGHISHFYLISGPAGAGKKTMARLLAAAIHCTGEQKPCMHCTACRKVLAGTHPDFITVDDPEKKIVPVELVRNARADIFIRPNESQRKVYLFPRGQDMESPSQNALLKILEEPPAYGVFLMITDNPEKLLPTIRSRATLLSLSALPEDVLKNALSREFPQATQEMLSGAYWRSGGYLGQARELLSHSEADSKTTHAFLESYTAADPLALTRVLVSMEKWKRDQAVEELSRWREVLENALMVRNGLSAIQPMAANVASIRSAEQLLQAVQALQKAITYAQRNVSVGAICGYLSWALR